MEKRWRRAAAFAALALACGTGLAAASPPMLPAPQIFAPGVISGSANDGSPTFSPDGRTLLFTRSGTTWGVILESHRTAGGWSKPRIASFSGTWNDWSPEFSPDGRYVVYVSVRPETHANLYRVDRLASGWSEPVRLPEAVNIGRSIWKPSMAADASIYFVSIDAKGRKRIYCSRFKDGAYRPARPVSFSDGTTGDVDPEVAPDESFMIFASDGRVPGDPKDHLFVVYRENGAWGTPAPIRYAGDDAGGYSADNEPHLSPDRQTLYFSSDRTSIAHFPRTPQQAQEDLDGIESWDNSNANAWSVPLGPLLNPSRP
jgi:hypothetical protein